MASGVITCKPLPFSSYADAGMLIGGTNGPGRGLFVQDTTFKKGVTIVGTNGPGPSLSTSTYWASPNDYLNANVSWGAHAGFAASPVFSSSGLKALMPFSRGGALAAGYMNTGTFKYKAHLAVTDYTGNMPAFHDVSLACIDTPSRQLFTLLRSDIGDPRRTVDARSAFYANLPAFASCTDPGNSLLTGTAYINEYKSLGFSSSAPLSRGGVPFAGQAASQSPIERARLSTIGFFISDRNAQAPFGRGGVLAMGN
jgi:hypothetical protein